MTKYRIIYKQRFMGEVLQDSYIRTIQSEQELNEAVTALYSDPHVFEVTYEKVQEEDDK